MPGAGRQLKAAGAWQNRAGPPCVLAYRPEVAGNYGSKNQENPRETQLARLPLIDPEKTTGDIRASFDRMPVKLNIFRMMAHAEANMIPAMRFANSILHKQKLSHVNRELLILQVAHIEGGEYEWRQHVPIALGVGVTAFIFDVTKPKLMQLPWFARFYDLIYSQVRSDVDTGYFLKRIIERGF